MWEALNDRDEGVERIQKALEAFTQKAARQEMEEVFAELIESIRRELIELRLKALDDPSLGPAMNKKSAQLIQEQADLRDLLESERYKDYLFTLENKLSRHISRMEDRASVSDEDLAALFEAEIRSLKVAIENLVDSQ